MSKNMVIWFIGLPLVVAGSVATGVILANTELISIPSTDPAELILGKWQYAGMDDSVSDTVSPMFRHTIEYFEDGTYQEDREGDSPILDPETINGTYVVLGDGRLKFTYESCHSLPCKDLVYVRKINFLMPILFGFITKNKKDMEFTNEKTNPITIGSEFIFAKSGDSPNQSESP